MKSKLFVIEGNIGVGKSTFVSLLNEHVNNILTIPEPREMWSSIGGSDNLLKRVLNERKRWTYSFQSYAFLTRLIAQVSAARVHPNKTHIIERFIYSDRYCFAKDCFEWGSMNALEWRLYQEVTDWLIENHIIKPDGFIYLRADPKTCCQRLQQRNNSPESSTQFSYVQKLHNKFDQFLIHKQDIAACIKDIPVLILDCNIDFAHSKTEQMHHIEKVKAFID